MFRTIVKRNQWMFHKSITKVNQLCILRATANASKNLFTLRNSLNRNEYMHKHSAGEIWNKSFVRQYASYPDHIKVPLPALSPTMESGTIVSWEKKEGDKLNEGDLLAEIETDKATMGFETPEEGYLAKIIVPAGTKNIPIGKLVCIIVHNQSDVVAFKDFKDDSVTPTKPVEASKQVPSTAPPLSKSSPEQQVIGVVQSMPVSTPIESSILAQPLLQQVDKHITSSESRSERVYASPMAKKLAEAQQIRLEGRGSGIYGSITSKDIAEKKVAKAEGVALGPPQGGYIDIPVSNVRSVIAKRLLESKQQIPHYYVTMECQIDNVVNMREKINKKFEKDGVKLSVNDFIIKATAIACRKVPEANSYWMGNAIRQFDNVDVSVAVATDGGLITPIIFTADRKGIIAISKETKELTRKARENKLKPQEFQGGTICVSNLGMFGVTQFCAVINPPQACILAVGTINKKVIPDSNNCKGFKEISVMNVTLSADHRVVDGAVAAKWLQYFRDFMEDPSTMIL